MVAVKISLTYDTNDNLVLLCYKLSLLQLVAYLDPDGKGYITKEYVQSFTIDQMKEILLFVDPNDVSNTEELEYSHIYADEIE